MSVIINYNGILFIEKVLKKEEKEEVKDKTVNQRLTIYSCLFMIIVSSD